MILVWLIAWLLWGEPALHEWNFWLVSLIVSVIAL
jgi:hypothetical protein